MKKIKLFLAACAAMVGLSANAQSWTSPGSDPVNDGQYYILNVGAGQFVTAANDWGTQLSATGTDTGLLIKTQAVSNVTVGGASLSGWELLNTNNSNKLLFRDSERWGYTDKGTQDKGYVWTITKVNGVYRLQTAAGDPAYPAASTQYAGANASLNGARVYFGYNSSSSDIDWMFLTEEQKSAANVVAKARLYRALMKAYAAGVNTDEASDVYENSASTAEELAAAVTNLTNACLQAHLDNASDSDPRDITEFVLSNSDFTQGNITGWETNYVSGQQANNIGYQDNNTYQSANGYVNRFIEAWRSGNAKIGDGYLRQTVSNMPEGKYVLECDAIATNQGNTSATTTGALLYINADGVDFTTSLSTAGSAVQHFSTEFLFTGEGDVIFGLKTQSTSANWIAADNFKVTYYGIDLTAYETQLAAAVAAFEALEGKVPSETYNTKKTTVLDVNNKEWNSSKEYSTAIAAIQTATSELNALAPGYAEYQAVRAAVLNTYNSTDVTSADASANSATTVEEMNDAIAAVRTALKTAITANNLENVDLTAALLINPSFETGDLTGWENTGMSVQGNDSFGKVGTYYAECWTPDGTKSIAQTLSGMPAGVYKVTATIKARGVTSAELSAGGVSKAMTISDDQIRYTVEFACDADADITIKYEGVGTKATSSWLCADDFTLTYVGALPELTAVTGKMNAEVAASQTTAVNTYNSEKNVTNYNAASAAIAAAETSVAAYAVAATALTDANALKDAHNFASAEATTTFAEAIAAVQTKYDEGTLTNDEATSGANLGTIVTEWHGGNNTSAAVYLRDGFALGDFAADPALHVNTWSTEGDNDGSAFSVPFYESWTADANSLPESTLTGTLSDLPNGLYSVSAWVRVKAKTGVEAAAATGITMDINGGGEGDYAAVDVTEGTQIGTGQFQIATYTAQGLVKQGKLTLNFNIAADANICWLAFKNVKYTKVRDLTPEEEFVAATAEDYAALNAAITAAEAKTLGFDAGDYAPYNNAAAVATLAAAKAIDQTVVNAQEDVQAATTALTGATWTANTVEVNAVYDGTFAAAENNGAPKGWRMSNNTLGGDYHSRAFVGDDRMIEFNDTKSGLFLRFDGTNSNRGSMYYYGDTENYTMPLKEGVTYYAKVDVAGWGSTGKPIRMNVTGPEGFSAQGQQFNTSVRADNADDTPQQFLIVFEATVGGNYVINFQTPGADTNTHNVVISNVEVKRADAATMKISDAQYATFVAPFDVTIPDDVTAYTVDGVNGSTLDMTEVETTIPANTPVVLYKESALDATTFYGKAVDGTPTAGLLTGVYAATPATAGTYVLQNNDDNVGFYRVAEGEGKQPTVGANRAYLTKPAQSGNVKAFFFDTETAIKNVMSGMQNGEIFDLSGRKVSKMQKGGIYIVNGQKVSVK